MPEISLEQGSSFATMLAVAAGAILLAGLFYHRAFGMLKARQWQLLLALRSVAIVLVILLLFRPVFTYHKELQEKPAVIFLLDSSASMGVADEAGRVSRFDQARAQIEKWWEKLKDDFQLRLMEFAERPRSLEGVTDLAGLKPEGKATSLTRALESAGKLLPHREVAAIVLLSDGVHNSGRSPTEVAGKLGVVVHTVGVGASLRSNVSHRDVQVIGIDCPDRLPINNIAKIKGSIEAVNLGGRVVKVVLEEDEKQVAEHELTLDDLEGAQEVVFDYRPTQKGRHVYTVRVPPLPEEKIVENNQRMVGALVVEPGIRVLYIEGTLRAEYGALVDRFLAKDPDLEFCALVRTQGNVFMQRSNMEGMKLAAIPNDAETVNKFDVFILGDIDSSLIRPAQQELIIQRVRARAGLAMLGGYHSLGPGGYAGTPLGDVLPAGLGSREIGQVTEPVLPTLTPEGARHPIFANIADFFPTRQQATPKLSGLPPLDGVTRVQAAKPGAAVLAEFPLPPGEGQGEGTGAMPVLAVQRLDKGWTAVFTGDTTRKWQQGPKAMDQDSPYTRFWGQLVRFLAGRSAPVEAGPSIVASTDKVRYEADEPVAVTAIVRNKEGQGAGDAKVVARLRGPNGRPDQVTLTAQAGPGGHYRGEFTSQTAGTHQIVVDAKLGDLTLTSDKLLVELGRQNLEFEKLDLDEKLLGQIAADAHGRYVHITTADYLVDQLDRSQRKKQLYIERQLYWPPLCWTLFVGALTIEWVLRRRYQLR